MRKRWEKRYLGCLLPLLSSSLLAPCLRPADIVHSRITSRLCFTHTSKRIIIGISSWRTPGPGSLATYCGASDPLGKAVASPSNDYSRCHRPQHLQRYMFLNTMYVWRSSRRLIFYAKWKPAPLLCRFRRWTTMSWSSSGICMAQNMTIWHRGSSERGRAYVALLLSFARTT